MTDNLAFLLYIRHKSAPRHPSHWNETPQKVLMPPGCIKHAPVAPEGMQAESNRCPATGRERNAICVPRTAVQTLYLKKEKSEQGEEPPKGLLLILCAEQCAVAARAILGV